MKFVRRAVKKVQRQDDTIVFVFIFAFILFFLSSVCYADHTAEYIFRGHPSVDLVYNQTINVLNIYSIPILETKGSRYVKTDWYWVKRFENKLFQVRYEIWIEGGPVTTIRVLTKASKEKKEVKATWWFIKKVARMVR